MERVLLITNNNVSTVRIKKKKDAHGNFVYDGADDAVINAGNQILFSHDLCQDVIQSYNSTETTMSLLFNQVLWRADAKSGRRWHCDAAVRREMFHEPHGGNETSLNRPDGSEVDNAGALFLWTKLKALIYTNRYVNSNHETRFRDSVIDFIMLQNIDYSTGLRCRCDLSKFEHKDRFVVIYDNACSVSPQTLMYITLLSVMLFPWNAYMLPAAISK